jgi:hypothetical protein
MRRKMLFTILTGSMTTLFWGCSQDNSIQAVADTDGTTSASSIIGNITYNEGQQQIALAKGLNNFLYCAALSKNYDPRDGINRHYISCKRQTEVDVDQYSWQEQWLWKDATGDRIPTSFIPEWCVALGLHSGTAMCLFTINNNDGKVVFHTETAQSSNSWGDWTTVMSSTTYRAIPPFYTGYTKNSTAINVFCRDNSTRKVRVFQKGSGSNNWTTYLLGNIGNLQGFHVFSRNNTTAIVAWTYTKIYFIQDVGSGFPSTYTTVSNFINIAGDVKLGDFQTIVAQRIDGLYTFLKTGGTWNAPTKLSTATSAKFELGVSAGGWLILMYLNSSGMKLFVRDNAYNWSSQCNLGPYPNQSIDTRYSICLKSYNLPLDNRLAFFGNFDNQGLSDGDDPAPGMFDVWQIDHSNFFGEWVNLGGLYDY